MLHLNDKEFEQLFRKGSEQYDFEYNAEAWSQMEVLLNRQRRRKMLLWWLAGLLALLVGAWLMWPASGPSAGQLEDTQQTVYTSPSEQTISESLIEKPAFTTDASDGKEETGIERVQKIEEGGVTQQTLPAGQTAVGLTRGNHEQHEEVVVKNNSGNRTDNTLVTTGIPNVTGQASQPGAIESQETTNDQLAAQNISDRTDSKQITSVVELPLARLNRLVISRVMNRMPYYPAPERLAQTVMVTKVGSTPLFVTATAGLVWSSAGTMGYSDADWKFGVGFQKAISPRWAVQIGVQYVKDSYQAGRMDYRPEDGFFTDKVKPDWTDAQCTILEIPLGVSFFPGGASRPGFFFSANLASVFMLRETYYYHYEDPQPQYVKYWHGNMENKDWFSMLELSVGYQGRFSEKLQFRIRPYIQLPTHGIGHGNVMLKNIGLSAQMAFQVK